ncbi:MAG: HDOD domain-containing protein [Rubrivivax sp.]|nr:HDOD domain-containing protein [Rubrivivax sp.]
MSLAMIDAGATAAALVPPLPEVPASTAGAATARLAALFRHSLRAGQVHPALHLLQRHRALPGVLESAVPAAPRSAAAPVLAQPLGEAALERSVGELPALPQIVLELMTLLQDDNVNAADFATRIAQDQTLVARTLRLANSPFYGVSGRVGTIHDAVQVLGMRTVGTLLMTAAVSSRIAQPDCPGFDFPGFWKHALATGITARALARAARLNGDMAFAAGLLHDIGRLVLASRFPQQLAAAIGHSAMADCPEIEAEHALLGCDHADVGTHVAKRWHFPAAVVDAIARHHRPGEGANQPASITDAVHVADALAHGLDLTGQPSEAVPGAVLAAWSRLALADAQYMSILEQTEEGVTALCEALAL